MKRFSDIEVFALGVVVVDEIVDSEMVVSSTIKVDGSVVKVVANSGGKVCFGTNEVVEIVIPGELGVVVSANVVDSKKVDSGNKVEDARVDSS